jgi:hypothetical protein
MKNFNTTNIKRKELIEKRYLNAICLLNNIINELKHKIHVAENLKTTPNNASIKASKAVLADLVLLQEQLDFYNNHPVLVEIQDIIDYLKQNKPEISTINFTIQFKQGKADDLPYYCNMTIPQLYLDYDATKNIEFNYGK